FALLIGSAATGLFLAGSSATARIGSAPAADARVVPRPAAVVARNWRRFIWKPDASQPRENRDAFPRLTAGGSSQNVPPSGSTSAGSPCAPLRGKAHCECAAFPGR